MASDLTATYRQLQQLAKDAGLLAIGSTAELRQRLADHRAQIEEGPNRGTETPDSKGVDRVALLRVAAGTPLPAAQSADGGQAHQERCCCEGNTQQLLSQLAASTTTARRSTWLRGVTAVVAAVVLALAVSNYKHCDCPVLARSLPELATKAAVATYSELRAQVLAATDAVQAQWKTVLSKRNGSHAAVQCHLNLAAVLRVIMGSKMEGAQAAAAAMLSSSRMNSFEKAAVVLLVCQTDADCYLAVNVVSAAVVDQRCVLHLHGQHLGTDKGALQHRVGNHLKAVPNGMVILSRMNQLSPVLLPVLINGMSEHGSFQQDGQAISTAGATFILTSVMPAKMFESVGEETAFSHKVKTHLVLDLTQQAATADMEANDVQAKALRRRIDVVLPVHW